MSGPVSMSAWCNAPNTAREIVMMCLEQQIADLKAAIEKTKSKCRLAHWMEALRWATTRRSGCWCRACVDAELRRRGTEAADSVPHDACELDVRQMRGDIDDEPAWTREPPTEPGWYWYVGSEAYNDPALVNVKHYGDEFGLGVDFVRQKIVHQVLSMSGHWQGPIKPHGEVPKP